MKYPGGYQIIDLKGVTLGDVQVAIDPAPWIGAIQIRKPIYITNFKTEHLDIYIRGPLLLNWDAPNDGYFVDVHNSEQTHIGQLWFSVGDLPSSMTGQEIMPE